METDLFLAGVVTRKTFFRTGGEEPRSAGVESGKSSERQASPDPGTGAPGVRVGVESSSRSRSESSSTFTAGSNTASHDCGSTVAHWWSRLPCVVDSEVTNNGDIMSKKCRFKSEARIPACWFANRWVSRTRAVEQSVEICRHRTYGVWALHLCGTSIAAAPTATDRSKTLRSGENAVFTDRTESAQSKERKGRQKKG